MIMVPSIDSTSAFNHTASIRRIVSVCLLIGLIFYSFLLESFGESLNDKAFYTYESKFYITQSDRSEAFAKEIGLYMDMMNHEYRRRLTGFKNKLKMKFHVRIYKKKSTYHEFTGDSHSSGIFMSSKRLLCSYRRGRPKARLLGILRHEGFHQFMYTHIARRSPPWINEGFAEHFEYAVQEKNGFNLNIVPRDHVMTLKKAMKNNSLIPLSELLIMGTDEWNYNLGNRSLSLLQYAQSWSVVHFLLYGSNGNNKSYLDKYLRAISQGKTCDEAFEHAFGRKFDTLNQDWILYVKELIN